MERHYRTVASKGRKVVLCGAVVSLALVLVVSTRLFRDSGTDRVDPSEIRSAVSADPTSRSGDRADLAEDRIAHRPRPRRLSEADSDPNRSVDSRSQPSGDADEARAWTRTHLEEALLWIVDAPPGHKRDAVLEIACFEVAQYKPAEAAALAVRYGGGRTDLLENVAQQWAAQDAAAAEDYAVSKPEGEMRNRLLGRVAVERAKGNPKEAALLAIEKIAPGQIRDEAVIAVLQKWIETDIDASTQWAFSFPTGELRDRALGEISKAMAYADE